MYYGNSTPPNPLIAKWYDRTVKMLQINGKGVRTQQAYARSVRMLIEYFDKDPEQITEEQLRDYFVYRQNDCKWAPNTLKICYCGIKFFFKQLNKFMRV